MGRTETLATIAERRAIARAATHAESMENHAHATGSIEWEWRNEAKWCAYEAAMGVIPGIDGETGEDDMLTIFGEITEATDYALARKWRLAW
jgi:hypothetical protein